MMKIVRNNRPGLYDAGGCIILLPGENPLDTPEKETDWKKAKKNEVVAARLKPSDRFPGGELNEFERSENQETTDGIKGLNRKQAVFAVDNCDDPETLRNWTKDTKDNHVKKVIKARIEELEKADSDGEKEDE
jgi:hypothetical protein